MSQAIDELLHFVQSTHKQSATVTQISTSKRKRIKARYDYTEIVQFWFGTSNGKDWTDNLRNKWFVPSNSKEQMELDAHITETYGDLLQCLYNNTNNLFTEWKTHSLHSCLASIIVLDQFSRHIYRGQRAEIVKYDQVALELSRYIIEECGAANSGLLSHTFTIPQYIFCLMPYRHSKQLNHIEFVLKQIDGGLNENVLAFSELITRFKRATIKQLQGMQSQNEQLNLHDQHNFDDILEHNGFDYEVKCENDNNQQQEEKSENQEQIKQKRKWKKRAHAETKQGSINANKLYGTIKTYLMQRNVAKLKYLFVSLSGGVDSMVIAKILHCLRLMDEDRSSLFNYEIVAIHIDYGNRQESHKEALFLEQWCKKYNIIFRKRAITEIKRGVTKRDDYERLSRDIRFSTYKQVLTEFGCGDDQSNGIMFGHHQGDVQENIISNMMKGCSLLNLSGMGEESVINGVLIWRPLLVHHKSDIFAFAHKFGVPYFKDTTPKWSSRGRMRNELLPLLKDIFGDGFLHNLSTLSTESLQFQQMAKQNIFDPLWSKIKHSQCAAWIDCNGYEQQSLLFWKETLKYMCEDIMGLPRIHEKGIRRELMSKLNYVHNKSSAKAKTSELVGWWLQLRREYKCYLTKEKILIIFVPEFAPILSGKIIKHNFYVEHGTELKLRFDQEYTFGAWRITFFEEQDISKLHDEKFRIDLFDIANGSFFYFLPLLTDDGKYMIDKTKNVRRKLKCFRCLPHGMKDILPMVIADGTMQTNSQTCVRVVISFQRTS